MSFYLYFHNQDPSGFEAISDLPVQQDWNFLPNQLYPNQNQYNLYSFSMPPQNSFIFPTELPEQIPNPPNLEAPVIQREVRRPNPEKRKRKRQKNISKEIESAKKNGESNLVNHFFSYYCSREKSEEVVERCIGQLCKNLEEKQKILYIFYHVIQLVKAKRNRKYVNRILLVPLIEPDSLEEVIPEISEKLEKVGKFYTADLCSVYRRCIFYFYRNTSINSVATSRRISSVAKLNHMERRRKINTKLFIKEK